MVTFSNPLQNLLLSLWKLHSCPTDDLTQQCQKEKKHIHKNMEDKKMHGPNSESYV